MEIKSEHRELFNEIVSKIDKKEYVYYTENGKVILYINYYIGRDFIMYYNKEFNHILWLNYSYYWSNFESKFGLTYYQLKAITLALVKEYAKFNGVTTF